MGQTSPLDFNVDDGLFGWMNLRGNCLLPVELTMVLMCSILGIMGDV